MNSIDRTQPLPLWAQVLGDLRARLAAGEFDERFATDEELVARYGVSRHTVREAVRRLSDEGIVERMRGRGTRVRAFRQSGDLLESLFEQVERQGASQRSVVLRREITSDPVIAANLALEPDAGLVMIERLRLADDIPLALDRAWLPQQIGEALLSSDLSNTGLYAELQRETGIVVDSGSEQIRPIVPDEPDRLALQLPSGQAAFSIERLTRRRGQPVEWRHSVVRGDRYTITLDLTPAGPGVDSSSHAQRSY